MCLRGMGGGGGGGGAEAPVSNFMTVIQKLLSVVG